MLALEGVEFQRFSGAESIGAHCRSELTADTLPPPTHAWYVHRLDVYEELVHHPAEREDVGRLGARLVRLSLILHLKWGVKHQVSGFVCSDKALAGDPEPVHLRCETHHATRECQWAPILNIKEGEVLQKKYENAPMKYSSTSTFVHFRLPCSTGGCMRCK
jgi:hypothetical protein